MSSRYGSQRRYVVVHKDKGFLYSGGRFVHGKSAWLDERVLYSDRAVANQIASMYQDCHIEQIMISAYRFGWSPKKDEVPKDGTVAFSQGWDVAANPIEKGTPQHLWWTADWWVANATAFQSHCEQEDTA
jgi:hypothetical protein